MNPLAFGAFFTLVAVVKCVESVCVVSPFTGMGGSWGPLGGCRVAYANAAVIHNCNPNKMTKAIAGNSDVWFLFIVDLG